jgi:protein-L-isoaspartate(D-aspartate) O-methyltransferase
MQSPSDFDHDAARQSMVELIKIYVQLSSDQIDRERLEPRVIAAMTQVPRHAFVPVELQYAAYADRPIPIGCGKTVSQPFMVALSS